MNDLSTKKGEKMTIYNDDFERVVLLENLSKRYTSYDNESVIGMRDVISCTSMNLFNRYRVQFARIGYDFEDIKSISTWYAYHYFGVYSLKNNKEKRDKYHSNKNNKRTMKELEKIILINYLTQRLTVLKENCNKKSSNVVCGKTIVKYFAHTKESVRATDAEIMERHSELGYRAITLKKYKEIKKQGKRNADVYDEFGFKIITVKNVNNGISVDDYSSIVFDDNAFYKRPDSIVLNKEDDMELSVFKKLFSNMSVPGKISKLKKFIYDNSEGVGLKGELKTARKLIKTLKKQL